VILTGLREVDKALVELWRHVEALKSSLIGRGNLLTGLAVSTTAKPFAHKLGRKLNGYVVVGSTVATEFADDNAGKADLDRFVYLKAGASTVANVWVF
jgi:hypothetical protein